MALVLMMTIPGLGLFYGGMVRKKNVVDTVMTSFAITCLVTVLFAAHLQPGLHAGNALHRRPRPRLPARHLERRRNARGNPNPLAPTIPETVYMCFQMTFAIITPALIAGAFAERMKFSAMLCLHDAVGDLRLCADRALGLGPGRLPQRQPRAWVRFSTSPAVRSCTSMPALPD